VAADDRDVNGVPELRIGREDEVLVLTGTSLGFDAELTLPGLRAVTDVSLTDANLERPLSEFADDLAQHWRGWHGTKQWQTYGGQLKLTSGHDGRGLVNTVVELREFSGNGWVVPGEVLLDAGQLEQFARQARRFWERP
jgi:hypothetical protein